MYLHNSRQVHVWFYKGAFYLYCLVNASVKHNCFDFLVRVLSANFVIKLKNRDSKSVLTVPTARCTL